MGKDNKESLVIKVPIAVVIIVLVILVIGIVGFCIYLNSIVEEDNIREQNTGMDVSSENITDEQTQAEIQINIDSSIVTSAYEKVNKSKDYIYKYADIKNGNIPNELKLRMALSNMEGKNLETSLDESYSLLTGQTYSYSVEDFSKEIKNILGNDATFTNETFTATEDRFSTGGGLPKLIYNSEENRYETNDEYGGSIGGYVMQFITSATTQGDYLNLYINPVFMCSVGEPGVDSTFSDEICDGYVNYNYETDTFSDKVISKVETYSTTSNVDLDKSKLDTYKYTFIKDGDAYYFDSLEKVK